jgi:hypothetical protein
LVAAVAVKLIGAVPSELVSEMVLEGAFVPTCAAALIALGLTFSKGVLLITNVTGMVRGELPAPCDVMLTVPRHMPAGCPVGLTDTPRIPGVVLIEDVTDKNPVQF